MSAEDQSEKSLPSFGIDEEQPHQSVDHDYLNARSFLLQCGDSDYSLWTHLNELLKKVIEDRPTNVVDYFEEYSRRLKAERFATLNLHLRELYIPPVNLEFARKKISLLKSVKNASEEPADLEEQPEGGEEEEVVATKKRAGFLENMNLFKECGISLQIEECYAINLSVLKLMSSQPLKSVRFWGKIFGLKKDYIVAECELTDEELTKRIEEQVAEEERLAAEAEAAAAAAAEKEAQQEAEKQEAAAAEAAAKAAALEAAAAEGEEEEFIPPPPSIRELYKMPPEPKVPEIIEVEVPKERDGEGVNRKIYYVCNDPGDEWIPLPNLLPNHIIMSRKIKKYFTGELTKQIVSFPVFEGTEKEYLRAQIGRISAATQISPLGYFTFHEGGEEEEEDAGEEEDEEAKSTYVENSEFEPLPIKDLVDPTMAFWVHHTQHILKQGRTKWWSSKPPKGEEEAEGEEEEDEEGEAPETPEVGPPLLTPLSEDISLEGTPPWTVRNTSVYTPENAVALVCSNLWPGAYAYAVGKKFGNIYFGWGHKYMPNGYSPQPLPFPEDEYEGGPEIMEIDDPTPEAEEEWRLAHEKKPPKGEGEEGEEEGEEEEAGDDDE